MEDLTIDDGAIDCRGAQFAFSGCGESTMEIWLQQARGGFVEAWKDNAFGITRVGINEIIVEG
ncbi:MAG: hypothetical protein AAF841_05925 [Pseudomonadota bacterium]